MTYSFVLIFGLLTSILPERRSGTVVLILFTFLPANDYNIMSLKISLFIVSFSLYFTINAFFFNDEAMHKIYKENGVFDILYQIPQILYSSIIPTIITYTIIIT